MFSTRTVFLIYLNIAINLATTEWYGDLRAYMSHPENPPYHDVIYDDNGN